MNIKKLKDKIVLDLLSDLYRSVACLSEVHGAYARILRQELPSISEELRQGLQGAEEVHKTIAGVLERGSEVLTELLKAWEEQEAVETVKATEI